LLTWRYRVYLHKPPYDVHYLGLRLYCIDGNPINSEIALLPVIKPPFNYRQCPLRFSLANMDGPNNGIILYHYSFSPYARRVIWYLALRGMDFAQCVRGHTPFAFY
jgi:hypothetical protein